jgi:RNA polymerase sigma factor (sigma-70 family)
MLDRPHFMTPPSTGQPGAQPSATQDAQLEEFARRFRPALVRFFGKRARQRADVEDLVQEVFARVAGRSSSGEIRDPQGYLMQAAANVWRDWVRRQASHASAVHDAYDDDRHAPEGISPERVLEARQSVQPVLAALAELTEATRQVFVLCRIEGMKYSDAARRLGVSVSAIEKHMMKAIAHLANRLGDR